MARLRDIKVGMKVQIVKGKEKPEEFDHYHACDYIEDVGFVTAVDLVDRHCAVKVTTDKGGGYWWWPASWIKIIKDEGETKLTKAQPQKYILIDEEYVSQVFTDISTKGILDVSNDVFDERETVERLKEGKMKLFKIEEVKLEVTKPSIKIVG